MTFDKLSDKNREIRTLEGLNMPRERKLTIEEAIEKSMFAFWEHGFGLGVRNLEQITGINRFMLQTELGGKEGLFLHRKSFKISLKSGNYNECRGLSYSLVG